MNDQKLEQKSIGFVLESAPNQILIEINKDSTFEDNKSYLQVGKYLKISDGNNMFVIAIILDLKAINELNNGNEIIRIMVNAQPVGHLLDGGAFEKGGMVLPLPLEPAYVMDDESLLNIFNTGDDFNMSFGKLVQNSKVELKIDGNKFFSKHVGIVGSTGSGKSCTVARILQDAVGINNNANINLKSQKNAHIIIFDIHSEYEAAFKLHDDQKFTLNTLNVDKLKLPYWLMNSEELESMFIESNESNSHNQISQFKYAVTLNKEKHNTLLTDITYDSPVYFNIEEVFNYISNVNREIVSKLDGETGIPKLKSGSLVRDKIIYFDSILEFCAPSQTKDDKASNGPFNGEFDRFISRLETKLHDKRLKFLLDPIKKDGTLYKTSDFAELLQYFLGYLNKSNITIIDLSGIPFEVLSVTVSLISRLVFDFCFHYSKIKHSKNEMNDIPFMIVCEEAHNYVPRNGGAEYKSSKKSIERIAKEGRKYGLSLMVVSQRPSEVSETIFAQCNNFVALRLTNTNDQSYIKSLMPDNSSGVASVLPNLSPGECLIVGDSVLIPSIVKLEKPNPEPKSQSVKFHNTWNEDWKVLSIEDVAKRWWKEDFEVK